jgi:hypothetical protein
VALELQLSDHRLVEEPDDVRTGAHDVALVVERALQGAGAAEALAALQHEDALTGASKVGGGGEAVVAAANDDGVPITGGQLGDWRRQADLAHEPIHVHAPSRLMRRAV